MSRLQKKILSEPDQTQHFQTDHLKADLKGRSVRGGAVTMVSQGCKFVLQMGSTVVLARLLSPQDYGLIGMVTSVTGIVFLFNDMGLSTATIQRAEINHKQVSTLFWVNVGMSLLLMLLTAVMAPAIAWFYGEPRLTWIAIVSASAFIFGGLSVQHQALLRRQMRFTALAAIEIVSIVLGVAIAIISALYGAGYWSLVFMSLTTAIVTAAGVWVMCGWRPGLPAQRSGVRSMLAFGGNLTGFSVLNYCARNLDNILIGRVWGAEALGVYAKAYSLMMLPLQQINSPITAVAVPGLSRLHSEPQQFRNHYLKGLSLIGFLTTPIVLFMMIVSEELVELILGSQWGEAGTIFKLLGISALVQPLTNTSGWLYISSGRTAQMFKWGVFSSSFLVISFFFGLPYGARGVALSYSIAKLLQTLPCMYYATRGTSITMLNLLEAMKHPLLASLIAGAIAFGVKLAIAPTLTVWATVIVSLAVMALTYLILMFYVFNTKELYLSVLKQFKRPKGS
ncbi:MULTISPECIES: MOP flippase family protein [unclassified Coleofasciculus]|uniref:MOP flippase family protein n=1 Tax=Cyanophyceae TaxID=3028117 RepID=UPI0018EF9B9E|nr:MULTISPECIES: MOP flippase family protein [unclassified Coleofasciculus]